VEPRPTLDTSPSSAADVTVSASIVVHAEWRPMWRNVAAERPDIVRCPAGFRTRVRWPDIFDIALA
jgi:hypothetical protein